MIVKKIKLFFPWNYKKEETWLNTMSEKGYQLQEVIGCQYRFIQVSFGPYQYHVQKMKLGYKKADEYIKFLQDAGVEYVTAYNGNVYFRQAASKGEFQLFSDYTYHRKRNLHFLIMSTAFMLLGLVNGVPFLMKAQTLRDVIGGAATLFVSLLFGSGVWKSSLALKKIKAERSLFE